MRKTRSLDRAYFDSLYAADPDPWGFETSAYEAAKYEETLKVVARETVARGFEMGCSIGVLTVGLASLCDHLVATELSPGALDQARRRCAGRANVEFRLATAVADGLEGPFDLILLSEVVYYWEARDLETVAAAIRSSLTPGGRLVLVHWLGPTDYPHSADDAVTLLFRSLGDEVDVLEARRTADYRLDVWRRPRVGARGGGSAHGGEVA